MQRPLSSYADVLLSCPLDAHVKKLSADILPISQLCKSSGFCHSGHARFTLDFFSGCNQARVAVGRQRTLLPLAYLELHHSNLGSTIASTSTISCVSAGRTACTRRGVRLRRTISLMSSLLDTMLYLACCTPPWD